MLHYAESAICITVCYLILILAGAVHIAYGSYFIELGQYLRDHNLNNQQLFLDNLPLGTYAIVIGIFMILAALGLRIVLTRKLSMVGEMTVWIANWMVCIFNFALAVLEVRMYVFQEQSFTKFGLHIPTISQFTVPYYLELADGIFSFVVVFPVTLYLVYLANFRMVDAELRNRLYIVGDPQQVEVVEKEERMGREEEVTEREVAINTE